MLAFPPTLPALPEKLIAPPDKNKTGDEAVEVIFKFKLRAFPDESVPVLICADNVKLLNWHKLPEHIELSK